MQLIRDDYLQPNGVDFQDAVQVRAYLPDLSEWPEAKKEIGKLSGKYPLPPMIPIEWAREGTVEIEVIASMAIWSIRPSRRIPDPSRNETISCIHPCRDRPRC
jgi:hypothetical protein